MLGAALLARAVVPIVAAAFHGIDYLLLTDDGHQYLQLAESLTAGDFSRNGAAEVLRVPGYPLLVALGVWAGHPIGLTIFIQTVLGGVTAVMVYALAQQIAVSIGRRDARRIALAAGLLYALDPLSVVHASFVLSETLFTTLMVVHLFVLSKYFENRLLRYVALSGVLAAAAAFVRPVAQYWPLVVVAVLLLFPPPRPVERRVARFVPALVFLMVAAAPLMLWTARNATQTGYWSFSTAGVHGLYVSLGSSVAGMHRDAARQRVDTLAERHGWTVAERYDFMRREGVRLVVSQPAEYLAIHARAMLRALTPAFSMYVEIYYPDYGSASTWSRLFGDAAPRPGDYVIALPVFLLVGLACAAQYGLALVAVPRLFASRDAVIFLLLVTVAYFLIMAGAVGDIATARMRHPAMPAICVLAAFGAFPVMDRYWPRNTDAPRHG